VPYRRVASRPGERGQRLREQPSQAPEIPGAAETTIRLQFGRIAESSDEMRIDVLIGPPGTVQS
jgi:hypothetical protein